MIETSALRKFIIDKGIEGSLVNNSSTDDAAKELENRLISNNLVSENAINRADVWIDLPENWTWTCLGNLTDSNSLNDGNWVLKKDMSSDGTVKLIQLGSIGNCLFKDKDYKLLTEEHFKELDGKQIYPGYMLINRLITDRMNSCIIPEIDGILMTAVDVCWVKPNNDLYNIKYLMYVIASSGIQNLVKKLGHGVTRFRISKTNLIKIPIPYPPLSVQNMIVDKIEEMFAILDKIDKLRLTYLSNLKILKNKLIDAGIQGKLTEQLPEDGTAEDLYAEIQIKKNKLIQEGKIKKEKYLHEITEAEIPFNIPPNWKWVRLGNISAKIASGSTPVGGNKSDAYVEKGYSFFREQNIYNDGIHEEGLVFITEKLLKARANSTVLPMDILLNITGGSIGRCALVPDEFTQGSINQHILIIRMIDPRLRFYVHKYICSPYIQKYIRGNTVGDKDGFSAGRCKNMLIPLPPLNEQTRIVERIDEIFANMK